MVVAERPKLVGAQTPRIRIVPDGEDHPRWSEVEHFIRQLGVEPDPWQLDILRVSLRRSPADTWAAFTVAICAPRQNGKNGVLELRELVGAYLLGEKLVIHSAHLADTSKEAFRRLDDLIDANEWLARDVKHVWRTNGHEAIEFRNGNRIRFRTRTRGGGRGFSSSPVIFDEAMFIPEISMAAIMPVISAQPDPQIWYTGSAVDQAWHEDGVVFSRVRARALGGEIDRLAYWEWSLDHETPDELPEDLDLHVAAAATNPAYGIRISPDYVEAEARELGRNSRSLAVERFGVGDWPPVDGSAAQVIPLEKWDALADDPAAPGARLLDPVCIAFDVTPDRSSASIGVAGHRADGLVQLEIADRRPGVGWIPERLAELEERHSPIAILCDAAGPAGSLLPKCADLGLNVEPVSAPDHGKACGLMFDLVDARELRHLGGADLRNALRGATKRSLGDAWAWSRRNSTYDISPLVAVTLALWGYSSGGYSDSVEIF